MGNKPTVANQGSRNMKRNIQGHLSEEDYIPMSLAMKKVLIEGKRFHHYLPSRHSADEVTPKFVEKTHQDDSEASNVSVCITEKNNLFEDFTAPSKEAVLVVVDGKTPDNQIHECAEGDFLKGVSCINSLESQKHSDPIIGAKFSPKKSSFTLQLEERLRRSKLELGFDTDLDDLKEFTYKWEESEGRKRGKSLSRLKLTSIREKSILRRVPSIYPNKPVGESLSSRFPNITKRLSSQTSNKSKHVSRGNKTTDKHISWHLITEPSWKSTSKLDKKSSNKSINSTLTCNISGNSIKPESQTTEYCAQTCQILGLCNLGKTKLRPNLNLNSSFFEDGNNNKQLEKCRTSQHRKEECNCDLCTLAYLTDMSFQGDVARPLSANNKSSSLSGRCKKSKNNRNNYYQERVKIIEDGEKCRAVEISVCPKKTICESLCGARDGSTLHSSTSVETIQDSTNHKIKKLFVRKDKPSSLKEIYTGSVVQNEIPVKYSKGLQEKKALLEELSRFPRTRSDDSNRVIHIDSKKSSSSILSASHTSSLSTVLSYKRVREIFQSIIEKNRPRKRMKRNINKFKEMEELGLGKLKNNRWYPSECKTFSIWSTMHSKFQGVQAQFKKYPKTPLKL